MEENINKGFRIKTWQGVVATVLITLIGWGAQYSYKLLDFELEQMKTDQIIKNEQEEDFSNTVKVLEELYDLIDETDADRALIVNVHNGSGQIRVGSEKKFDILYEAKRGLKTKKIKKEYQNFPLDEGTIRIMNRAIQNQFGVVFIPDIDSCDFLQNQTTLEILKYEGIESLTCKYIGIDKITKTNMFFLYINHFEKNPQQHNDFIQQHVNRAGRAIRTKINAY
mgnify:CR=1 FL=1